jgi:hypothetical protein
MDVSAQLYVIEDGHSFEEFDILEGSRYSAACHLVGAKVRDLPVFENDFPFIGLIEFRDAVYQARFPSPIGANEGEKLTLLDFQIDLMKSLHPTEIEGEVINF